MGGFFPIGGGGGVPTPGPPGPGVPTGGAPGEILAKQSPANYDTIWVPPAVGGQNQTPWLSDINAAGFGLSGLRDLLINPPGTFGPSSLWITTAFSNGSGAVVENKNPAAYSALTLMNDAGAHFEVGMMGSAYVGAPPPNCAEVHLHGSMPLIISNTDGSYQELVRVIRGPRLGIGVDPTQPLDVNGMMRTRTGGVMFPDNSVQITAAQLTSDAPNDGTLYGRRNAAWTAAVQRAGDTMTGPLILSGPPALDLQAVTKLYVDAMRPAGGTTGQCLVKSSDVSYQVTWETRVPEAPNDAAVYGRGQLAWQAVVPVTGATMSGPLVLAADPTQPMQAATMGYVDRLATGALHYIGNINALTGNVDYTTASGFPDGVLVPASASVGGFVICTEAGTIPSGPAQGITMRIGDWLVSDGTDWNYISQGGGASTLPAANVTLAPAVFGQPNVQLSLQQAETEVDGKLNLAGGTMTGALLLAGNPAVALEATPKQYVDARAMPAGGFQGETLAKASGADYDVAWRPVPLEAPSDGSDYGRRNQNWSRVVGIAGATMTGPLILSGNPTANLGAVPKQYIDQMIGRASSVQIALSSVLVIVGHTIYDNFPITLPRSGNSWLGIEFHGLITSDAAPGGEWILQWTVFQDVTSMMNESTYHKKVGSSGFYAMNGWDLVLLIPVSGPNPRIRIDVYITNGAGPITLIGSDQGTSVGMKLNFTDGGPR